MGTDNNAGFWFYVLICGIVMYVGGGLNFDEWFVGRCELVWRYGWGDG